MQCCNDAQMFVACILSKQKIIYRLVLLIKLACQFKLSFKNYVSNYSDTGSEDVFKLYFILVGIPLLDLQSRQHRE